MANPTSPVPEEREYDLLVPMTSAEAHLLAGVAYGMSRMLYEADPEGPQQRVLISLADRLEAAIREHGADVTARYEVMRVSLDPEFLAKVQTRFGKDEPEDV